MQKYRVQVWVAAWLLLVVALVIPQLAWADNASDRPDGQFDISADRSPGEAHAALVEKYVAGDMVFHVPGRQDGRSFSISPSEAYAVLVEKYMTGELVFHGPGPRDDRSFSASVTMSQTDAAFLAANPELAAYWHYGPSRSEVAAAANSTRSSFISVQSYYTTANLSHIGMNTMSDRRVSRLLPDDLDQHPLPSPPVKLPVEYLLPGAQVESAARNGRHHLAAHHLPLHTCPGGQCQGVGIGIVLTGAVVEVLAHRLVGRRTLQRLFVIRVQATLVVVYQKNTVVGCESGCWLLKRCLPSVDGNR